jgi:3-oxoacyl-(acyl-carrier-protein) synthase
MEGNRVAITGLGAYTCAGRSADALWEHAVRGESGIRDGVGRIDDAEEEAEEGGKKTGSRARTARFGGKAAREAMRAAGWDGLRPDDGLLFATTTGQIPAWEGPLIDHLQGRLAAAEFADAFRAQPLGSALDALKAELSFSGRTLLVSSACSAATQALALGAIWIRQGAVKRVLVVGAEVLCNLTLAGFGSLQLLAREGARPFDRDRPGINLSEGAGAICLEKASASAPGLAILSGYGLSTDGYHLTSPHPEGRGSYQAMRRALSVAGLRPDEVSWVHAHGTGSKHNDAAEGAALARLFSEVPIAPEVSSTKRIHGHALGASGAIEAVLCVQAIRKGVRLPTAGLVHPDPEIAIRHVFAPVSAPIHHVLKNTLGFGGVNASLVFSRPAEAR